MRASLPSFISNEMTNSEDIYLLLGDIGVFGFSELLNHFPERAINLGIAEQSIVGMAAGLAKEGCYPIFHTITPFMVNRAFEQIKVDFGYSKLPGLFISVGASYDYGKLGGTHHCPEDISLLSTIEGIHLYLPASALELEHAVAKSIRERQFAYIRMESLESQIEKPLANGELVSYGDRGLILAVGNMLSDSIKVAFELKMNLLYVNHIPPKVDVSLERFDRDVIIIEPLLEGSTHQALARSGTIFAGQVKSIGFPREFRRKYVDVLQHYRDAGLEVNKLYSRIRKFI